MVSHVPKHLLGQTVKRLVVDKEFRANRYQSEAHGKTIDDPKNLLWSFDLFPNEPKDLSIEDWDALIKLIKSPDHPDYLGFDNMSQFQNDVETWTSTGPGCKRFLDAVGISGHYDLFLKYYKPGAMLWNVRKAGIRQMILIAKMNGMNVGFTAELRNDWKDFGQVGKQRIDGQLAKVWDNTMSLVDVNWRLTRSQETLLAAPEVQLDPKMPKNSIVGIPPKFKWQGWENVWEMEARRVVPDEAAMATVVVPPPSYEQTEEQMAEASNPVEVKVATKDEFFIYAQSLGYNGEEMKTVLKNAALWPWRVENDATMREVLANAKKGV